MTNGDQFADSCGDEWWLTVINGDQFGDEWWWMVNNLVMNCDLWCLMVMNGDELPWVVNYPYTFCSTYKVVPPKLEVGSSPWSTSSILPRNQP